MRTNTDQWLVEDRIKPRLTSSIPLQLRSNRVGFKNGQQGEERLIYLARRFLPNPKRFNLVKCLHLDDRKHFSCPSQFWVPRLTIIACILNFKNSDQNLAISEKSRYAEHNFLKPLGNVIPFEKLLTIGTQINHLDSFVYEFRVNVHPTRTSQCRYDADQGQCRSTSWKSIRKMMTLYAIHMLSMNVLLAASYLDNIRPATPSKRESIPRSPCTLTSTVLRFSQNGFFHLCAATLPFDSVFN